MIRSRWNVRFCGLLAGLLLPTAAVACMWDYDTIRMERTRFPGTLELITGKFLRHSPEFYSWRIRDRLQRLEADPENVALLDDLAVAYDKTGQHEKAIETALRTESLRPGRYETAANLGTFYIHSGRLEEGISWIDRALKINPEAHFGREKYQKSLVEYVLRQRRDDPKRIPLADVTVLLETYRESPSARVAKISDTFDDSLRRDGIRLAPDETAAAVKGILGMMLFGKHDSPILLEALGTLLAQRYDDPEADAKLLAARAFLKASYEVPEGPVRTAYRAMAAQAVQMQTPRRDAMSQVSLEQVEADFQRELDDAQKWYAELRDRESSWIRDGRNPEKEFDRLYAAAPKLPGMNVKDPPPANETLDFSIKTAFVLVVVVAIGGLVGSVFLLRALWRSRSAARGHGTVVEASDSAPL